LESGFLKIIIVEGSIDKKCTQTHKHTHTHTHTHTDTHIKYVGASKKFDTQATAPSPDLSSLA